MTYSGWVYFIAVKDVLVRNATTGEYAPIYKIGISYEIDLEHRVESLTRTQFYSVQVLLAFWSENPIETEDMLHKRFDACRKVDDNEYFFFNEDLKKDVMNVMTLIIVGGNLKRYCDHIIRHPSHMSGAKKSTNNNKKLISEEAPLQNLVVEKIQSVPEPKEITLPSPIVQKKTFADFIHIDEVETIRCKGLLDLRTNQELPLELKKGEGGTFVDSLSKQEFETPAKAAKDHSNRLGYIEFAKTPRDPTKPIFHTLKEYAKNQPSAHGPTYRSYPWQRCWEFLDKQGNPIPTESVIKAVDVAKRPRQSKSTI